MPANPARVYNNKGWIGLGDWFGTGAVANRLRKYRSFKEARKFARSLKLKSQNEWSEFAKSGKLPNDIPASPSGVYKNKGWIGDGDWLGTGNIAPANRSYKSFTKARKFVRSLKLKTHKEWVEYGRAGKLPEDVPRKPERVYKERGWNGIRDWLGNRNLKMITENQKLRRFILESNNWEEFKSKLVDSTNKEKGDAFELLVKVFFKVEPKYQLTLTPVYYWT